jgi:hypothetical protein
VEVPGYNGATYLRKKKVLLLDAEMNDDERSEVSDEVLHYVAT